MRVTFLLILALCVYLSEAGRKDSDEDSGESKKYKKDKYNKYDKNNKNDKYNKQDKYNKYEKYDKYNKHEKSDKYNKYEKPNDKYNKYEKYDNRPQKYDRDDSDESQESHEAGDYNDFPLRNDDRFQKEKFYEKEFNHYKYNKYYDDGRDSNTKYNKHDKYDSRENSKYEKRNNHKKDNYHQKEDRHYESQPDHGFFDEAIQFSKRRLFSVPEEDDHFFDDVKHYNQKQGKYQQPQQYQYQQQQYPSKYPQQNAYHKQHERREWRQPEALQYQDNGRSAERYPGGDGNFKEQGPNTKYNWKQDREDFQRMRPLTISPAEKRDFVPTADMPDPPAPSEAVKMARYIVHNADWTTVATISTLPHIRHYPFVNTLSVSDGPVENGSGIPYLYMTELDMTPHDLAVNRKCSLSMSLAETDYCKQQSLDPEDPRCAHVTITGEMWKLQNGTQSAKLAEEALFSRHPVMKTWPKDHNFFFATLKIEQIILLDYFGGPKYVDVKEYLRATLSA